MSVQLIKRPRVAKTLGTELKIIADFEAGKQVVTVRCELGILPRY
jgi:hypothetical protein